MAKISKWGNSLAVRLPKKVVDALDLKDGDEINLGVREGSPPTFEVSRANRVEAAITALQDLRSSRPADFTFNRDEANSRD